jgi:hypothetical protein
VIFSGWHESSPDKVASSPKEETFQEQAGEKQD